jgi:tetratricopeptide (TPR) repeat protein
LIEIGKNRHQSCNYDGAINAYTTALEIDDENAEAYYRRSNSRGATGDFPGEQEDLQKARQSLNF